MSTRRRRVSVGSAKTVPIGSPCKKPFANSLNLATLPNQKISSFAELQSESLASLQALKKDMDHEHVFMVKATEAHTAKLKKRVKQETQEASKMSEAIDTDWKNFLADFEEDARENQASIEALKLKAESSAAHFTKTLIPELMKTVESNFDNIRNRYVRTAKVGRRLSSRGKAKLIDASAK